MQINNTTTSQQNFGMALKINKKAAGLLKDTMSMDAIENLSKIGKDLKDTKYFHLTINEDGTHIITSNNANQFKGLHFLPPKSSSPKYLQYNATWMGNDSGNLKKGDKVSGAIGFENAKAANDAYKQWNGAKGEYARSAEAVKLLDKQAIDRMAENEALMQAKIKVSNAVDDLMDKFGID